MKPTVGHGDFTYSGSRLDCTQDVLRAARPGTNIAQGETLGIKGATLLR